MSTELGDFAAVIRADVDSNDPLDGAPLWARSLHAETVATRETLEAILAKVDAITDDVKPTIEKLSSSPLFRMLGGK